MSKNRQTILLQNGTSYKMSTLQLSYQCISQHFNNLGTVILQRASWFPDNLLQPIINGFIHFQVVLTTASLLALHTNLSVSNIAPSCSSTLIFSFFTMVFVQTGLTFSDFAPLVPSKEATQFECFNRGLWKAKVVLEIITNLEINF